MDSREVIINAERSDRMDTELQSNINFLSYQARVREVHVTKKIQVP
jgi:hypothetical protein